MICHLTFLLIDVFSFLAINVYILELYNKDNYYYYIIKDTSYD